MNEIIVKQKDIEENILANFKGADIIAEIEKRKHDAIKHVVYGENSSEKIELELKSKYDEIRKLQAKEAIIEEVTVEVWDEQTDEMQSKVIDEVLTFENLEDGIKKSVLVKNLAKLAKTENKISDSERRESKAKRQNVLKNLDTNYEKELGSIMNSIGGTKNRQEAEKARQLALIRLKRQKRDLAHADLGDQAASFTRGVTMMNIRKDTEQERQKKLAMERHKKRLAARAKMNEEEIEKETKEKIDELFDENVIRVSSIFFIALVTDA